MAFGEDEPDPFATLGGRHDFVDDGRARGFGGLGGLFAAADVFAIGGVVSH